MRWSSQQYVKFEADRNRPIEDLLARIDPDDVGRAADLGCGPGNSTDLLARRCPGADVLGIDSSADMIAAARQRRPDLRFEQADIRDWQGDGAFDVLLANASLQWIPDHETLFTRLIGQLAPGGQLAVQMPDNLDEPAHRAMREVAGQTRWADRLRAASSARTPRHEPAWYLQRFVGRDVVLDVWRTTYHHHLVDGVDGVVEWFRGSGLRPYLAALDADDQAGFLAAYRDALDGAYATLADGTLILPFPRLFILATRHG